MAICLLGLGSNLGDRQATLAEAVGSLAVRPDIRLLAVSRWHKNRAVGGPPLQPVFLNGAVRIETNLSPRELLSATSGIATALGRGAAERWAARTIDIDLILYDELVIDSPDLVVPHPRCAFRRFVLIPAAEIAGDMLHPTIQWTINQLRDHALNAPPYVAITGPPETGQDRLAEHVADAVGARRIAGAAPTAAGISSGRDWDSQIELLHRRARLLDAAAWPQRERPAVGDFWLEESLCLAEQRLPVARRHEFQAAWRAQAAGVLTPKLLIVLDAAPTGTSSERNDRRTTDSPDDVAREKLRACLAARAAQPGRGPVLTVHADGDDPLARDEAVAAVQALEGLG